eukprot:TRINITY_DN25089_c0_g2_i1.p1 TRINITY_DN25089_c0_g2~~TRINITY_DN25089_c0_g2_i1.p1  ORF type:complete len:256 (+),score=20.65 TRINITY_DN25089_c0_g2_i1:64-831(+)
MGSQNGQNDVLLAHSRRDLSTWGGAPLFRNGFNPSAFAVPPPSAPWYWAPGGWKNQPGERQIGGESQKLEGQLQPQQFGATGAVIKITEPRRPSSASTRSSLGNSFRRPASVRASTPRTSRDHPKKKEEQAIAPQQPKIFQVRPAPWTTQHVDGAGARYNETQNWTPPDWLNGMRRPAGRSTFERDRPRSARSLQARRRQGAQHQTRAAGSPNPQRYGRSDGFTNNMHFLTARQCHIADLRQIALASPNLVNRVT